MTTIHVIPGAERLGRWCVEHALPHATEITVWGLGDDGAILRLSEVRRP